jgi:hypothetical protein
MLICKYWCACCIHIICSTLYMIKYISNGLVRVLWLHHGFKVMINVHVCYVPMHGEQVIHYFQISHIAYPTKSSYIVSIYICGTFFEQVIHYFQSSHIAYPTNSSDIVSMYICGTFLKMLPHYGTYYGL